MGALNGLAQWPLPGPVPGLLLIALPRPAAAG